MFHQGFMGALHVMQSGHVSSVLEIFIFLSALSFLPLLVISLTSFTRIIVVLAMLRQALGLQQTPPNPVLITLALLLTLFAMAPTFNKMNNNAYAPYTQHKLKLPDALHAGFMDLEQYMARHTQRSNLALIVKLRGRAMPKNLASVGPTDLIAAYMLSELTRAFQIGFVIFLPFVLIDLVVAAILMSLGMIMVPPTTISLPIKVLVFVLINGWVLVAKSLLTGLMGH